MAKPVAWMYEWAPLLHEQWEKGVSLIDPRKQLVQVHRYRNVIPLYVAEDNNTQINSK